MKEIGIIGIGNPLRNDDGIGIIIVKQLIKIREKLPKNIKIIDGGTGGMNLIHTISNYDLVIFVDAINFLKKPGESKFFSINEISNKKVEITISTHGENILKVISLSQDIYNKSQEILFFGIQPKNTSYGTTISPELKNNIKLYLKQIISKLNQIYEEKI